jgi:hypothetical protein
LKIGGGLKFSLSSKINFNSGIFLSGLPMAGDSFYGVNVGLEYVF